MSATVAYVVRHGRTQLNAAGCLRGQMDVPLDAEGQAEADQLGRLFDGVPADIVVTSPLRRAMETAAPIAEAVRTAPVVMLRLGDRDYGPWNGAWQRDVERRFGSVDRAPGVEPRARFEKRVWRGFEHAAASAEKALILVAHEAVNRVILATALGRGVDDPHAISQRTGCWNRLEPGPDGWSVVVLDAVPGDGRAP